MSQVLVPNPTLLSPFNTGMTQAQFLEAMITGVHIDAFGRQRVSEVTTLFDSQAQYSANMRDWSQAVVGTGAVTHLPNESSVQLSTGGGGAGASAIRQTRLCWRYQSGKSQWIFQTFVLGAAATNVVTRFGYFDANNGPFIERNDTDVRLVLRSATSGAPSDANFVSQADWNIDPMDGTGPSQKTIDWTKSQLMFIDLQWLGVGRVRIGFFLDGVPRVAHEFDNGNLLTGVYMTTANLPLRGEISNTGAATGAHTAKMICSSVMAEGGSEFFQRGNLNSASNGTTTIAVTTRRPILSVRPAATFNGITNHAWYLLIEALFNVRTNDIFWEVVFGGTLTGAAFAAASADSCVEADVSATAIAGGISVVKGYGAAGVGAASGAAIAGTAGQFPNSVDSLLGTQAGHSIVVTSMTGTANVGVAANWREIY